MELLFFFLNVKKNINQKSRLVHYWHKITCATITLRSYVTGDLVQESDHVTWRGNQSSHQEQLSEEEAARRQFFKANLSAIALEYPGNKTPPTECKTHKKNL